jgi:hypothetical protein
LIHLSQIKDNEHHENIRFSQDIIDLAVQFLQERVNNSINIESDDKLMIITEALIVLI